MLSQAEWREEVKKHFEKIKSEGTCIHRLDEELIRRRREELRSADLSPTSPLAQVLRYHQELSSRITISLPTPLSLCRSSLFSLKFALKFSPLLYYCLTLSPQLCHPLIISL